MAQLFNIFPDNPQQRLIRQAAAMLREGAVIVYPTDSCFALGCQLGDRTAQDRIRQIREVEDNHYMTLMCRDLSELSRYARVDNAQFRLLKNNTPGSYTFILEATREVPKRLQHPKRNSIGLRIPDHPVALALLEELGEPLLSTTLILPGDTHPLNDAEEISARLGRKVDLILAGGQTGLEPTTVVDLTGEIPVVTRRGKGDTAPFEA